MSALVTDNLPLIATAPDGIKRLRGLILELAVRGKLVPQDSADEPASELLKRIEAEKARLVKGGKIRKPKAVEAVGDAEKPFLLPVGWEWTRLPQITHYLIGKTPATKNDAYWDDQGIPWVSISDMPPGGTIERTSRRISARAQAEVFRSQPVPAGTLLMSFKLTVGKVAVLGIPAFHNEAIISISPLGGVSTPYLQYVLPSLSQEGQSKNALMGATLNSESLGLLRLPLPPLPEQHRIVARVDELMALCDRLEAEQAGAAEAHARLVDALLATLTASRDAAECAANWQRLREHFDTLFTTEASITALKQTVLQLAVMGRLVPQDPTDEPASELVKRIEAEKARLVKEGKIRKPKAVEPVGGDVQSFGIPREWNWVRLGQIGEWGAGATPLRTKPEYYGGSMPWFKSGELNADVISESEESVSELALKECSLRRNQVGDVLIAMYGATIGKCSILACEATTNQAVCACTPATGVFNRYLLLLLKALLPVFLAQGAGAAQPNISREKIIATAAPLPPTSEQHRIVAKVDELMALCDRLQADLATAREHRARLADTLVQAALEAA